MLKARGLITIDLGIVLNPGPARRVDPGPGRPGSVAGPGLSKKRLGTGPVRPGRPGGSTWDPADLGKPGRPGQTRLRPGFYIYIYMYDRNDVVFNFYN
jgi:hypothetical protein